MTALKEDVDHLFQQAKTQLPGASELALKAELYDVLNEFFNESSAWTENIDIPIIPNSTAYEVVPSEGGQIIRLAGVVDANNIPQPGIMPDFGVVVFENPYNVAQTFTATVVKNVTQPVPKGGVPDMPDFTLSVYGVCILDGLIGRMMLHKAKSYSDETLGQYHLKRFNDSTAMARVAKMRRNAFGTQQWRFPQGFSKGSQRGGISTANATKF